MVMWEGHSVAGEQGHGADVPQREPGSLAETDNRGPKLSGKEMWTLSYEVTEGFYRGDWHDQISLRTRWAEVKQVLNQHLLNRML